jgi:hypothetical protein
MFAWRLQTLIVPTSLWLLLSGAGLARAQTVVECSGGFACGTTDAGQQCFCNACAMNPPPPECAGGLELACPLSSAQFSYSVANCLICPPGSTSASQCTCEADAGCAAVQTLPNRTPAMPAGLVGVLGVAVAGLGAVLTSRRRRP